MITGAMISPAAIERRRQLLLEEIGNFLEMFSYEYEAYLDLETWEVVPCAITPDETTEFYPEEGHRILRIETRPSHEGFKTMVDFLPYVEDERLRERLYKALSHSKPFSHFKNIIYHCDRKLIMQWHNFHNEQLKKAAEEWMKDNKVTIEGTKLVSPNAKPFYFKEYFSDDLLDDDLFNEDDDR